MRIKDIMNKEPYVLVEEDTILNASKFMKQERIRNLPVVDKNKKLIGLITLREIINALASNSQKVLVKDTMLKQVTTVSPETPLRGAIEVMLLNQYGCLPVVNSHGHLFGMITEKELLKALFDMSKMPSDFFQLEKS